MNANHPQPLRSRLEVIRHRIPARLSGRGRYVALAVAALAIAGLAAIGTNVNNQDPQATGTATGPDVLDVPDRQDDMSRADRSARQTPSQTSGAPVIPAPTTPVAPQTTQAKPAPTTPAAPKAAQAKPAPAWVSPMPGAPVTSCYGERWGVLHAGVDLALPLGTKVQAVGTGTVETAGWAFGGYGISVVVDHGNGYLTHYAHLNDTAVSPGQRVAVGQVIGYEGSTGDSTGPHLHFEVHAGMWNQIDPAPWMRARGVSFPGC